MYLIVSVDLTSWCRSSWSWRKIGVFRQGKSHRTGVEKITSINPHTTAAQECKGQFQQLLLGLLEKKNLLPSVKYAENGLLNYLVLSHLCFKKDVT